MNQEEPKVKLTRIKGTAIAKLSIQNPPMNQLSGEVLLLIVDFLEKVKRDDRTQALLIEGVGLFSAGADVKEIWAVARDGQAEKALEILAKANSASDAIQNLGKPTVAMISKYCLGGGNELAMACTYRIATEDAKLGQPEINLGIMPGMGGTQRLPRLIDLELALKLNLSGAVITAEDALVYGLVDKIVSVKDMDATAQIVAQQLISNCPQRVKQTFDQSRFDALVASDPFKMIMQSKSGDAVAAIIAATRTGMTLPLDEALKLEQKLFSELVVKDSAKRGLAKFLKIDFEKKSDEKLVPRDTPKSNPDHSEELKMLREMIREFAEQEIRPNINRMEEAGEVPRELFNKMGEMGLYGASYPEKYGGSGLGKVAYCIVFEELCRVHASVATVAGAHMGLACGTIFLEGTEDQKQKYLRPAIEGKLMGAFALTEPEAGSDSGNIKTTAIKKDGGWVLNGVKQFITNGPDADIVVVIAQTDPFLKKDGLVAFIVETKWQGFRSGKVMHKVGIRASRTSELALDNVFVPDENLLGEVGKAFKMFMKTLNGGRLGLAAGCVGGSKRAFDLAFKYAHERQQFGMPIASNQIIQFYLADMRANIYLMEQAVYSAARKADEGQDIRLESAIVKFKCAEMNMWNVDRALQIHGGNGYMDEYEISRIWRDSRINPIFEGTDEIQRQLVYKDLFMSGGKVD